MYSLIVLYAYKLSFVRNFHNKLPYFFLYLKSYELFKRFPHNRHFLFDISVLLNILEIMYNQRFRFKTNHIFSPYVLDRLVVKENTATYTTNYNYCCRVDISSTIFCTNFFITIHAICYIPCFGGLLYSS